MVETGCQTLAMENARTKTIQVVVNGQPREVPGDSNIFDLLRFLEIDPARVAVELDRAIVRKADWETARVSQGSRVEIVWFVGGG